MDKKPYTARRWTDIPQGEVVEHEELTEKEKKRHSEDMKKMLQSFGISKPVNDPPG